MNELIEAENIIRELEMKAQAAAYKLIVQDKDASHVLGYSKGLVISLLIMKRIKNKYQNEMEEACQTVIA